MGPETARGLVYIKPPMYLYMHHLYGPVRNTFVGKISPACMVRVGVHCTPIPFFTISTITYKVIVVCATAEKADTLPLFLLYPYMHSVGFPLHDLSVSIFHPWSLWTYAFFLLI